MTPTDLQSYRRALLTLKRTLGGKIEDIRGEDDVAADSGPPESLTDSGDRSVHEYEEQVDRVLAESEVRMLEQVDAALARLDAGTFGNCANCGRPIPPARLQAVPYAAHCIDCARRLDRA